MQTDPREVPGGGKLFPKSHIVRLVVVRRASQSIAASESHGPGHSHSLTKEELSAAEHELRKKAAPPPTDRTSATGESSDTRSATPENMFEALKPTDIVVVGRETGSVRTVDSSGGPASAHATTGVGQTASEEKPTRRLFGHDDRHKDTVLRVWTGSDTIEYQCDEEFEIVKVERAGWKIYGAPENPFTGNLPYRATEKAATGGKPLWAWTSSVLPATANNQQYKMTFKINGELIDPDVVCGDPPPF
jgi:hypothetical protein